MAVYSSRKVTSTRHEWTVPVGTNHNEFLKAYTAARIGYVAHHNLASDAELWDDALWVTSDGEEIVIYFTTEDTDGQR